MILWSFMWIVTLSASLIVKYSAIIIKQPLSLLAFRHNSSTILILHDISNSRRYLIVDPVEYLLEASTLIFIHTSGGAVHLDASLFCSGGLISQRSKITLFLNTCGLGSRYNLLMGELYSLLYTLSYFHSFSQSKNCIELISGEGRRPVD